MTTFLAIFSTSFAWNAVGVVGIADISCWYSTIPVHQGCSRVLNPFLKSKKEFKKWKSTIWPKIILLDSINDCWKSQNRRLFRLLKLWVNAITNWYMCFYIGIKNEGLVLISYRRLYIHAVLHWWRAFKKLTFQMTVIN